MTDDNLKQNMIAAATTPTIPEILWQTALRYGKRQIYRPREMLFHYGELSSGLFCIESGQVKNFQLNEEGNETILSLHSGPILLGESSLLNGLPNITSAEAQTKVCASLIAPTALYSLLADHPEFAIYLFHSAVHKMRTASDQASGAISSCVSNRLARTLLDLEHYGIRMDETSQWYNITHVALARIIGTTRPNVTAYLNRLAGLGIIELKRNHLRILDHIALEQYDPLS